MGLQRTEVLSMKLYDLIVFIIIKKRFKLGARLFVDLNKAFDTRVAYYLFKIIKDK